MGKRELPPLSWPQPEGPRFSRLGCGHWKCCQIQIFSSSSNQPQLAVYIPPHTYDHDNPSAALAPSTPSNAAFPLFFRADSLWSKLHASTLAGLVALPWTCNRLRGGGLSLRLAFRPLLHDPRRRLNWPGSNRNVQTWGPPTYNSFPHPLLPRKRVRRGKTRQQNPISMVPPSKSPHTGMPTPKTTAHESHRLALGYSSPAAWTQQPFSLVLWTRAWSPGRVSVAVGFPRFGSIVPCFRLPLSVGHETLSSLDTTGWD